MTITLNIDRRKLRKHRERTLRDAFSRILNTVSADGPEEIEVPDEVESGHEVVAFFLYEPDLKRNAEAALLHLREQLQERIDMIDRATEIPADELPEWMR